MGMYDHIRCLYPLPEPCTEFQTKDLDSAMDNYEIRADGTLWIETYDVEDHSDPKAEGLMRIAGIMTRVNQAWVPTTHTGEVRFYGGSGSDSEYRAVFFEGKMRSLRAKENNAFDGVNLMKETP